jgi:hypothetical protein
LNFFIFFSFLKGEGHGDTRRIDDLLVVNFDNIASSKIEQNCFISNFMSLYEKINQTYHDELSFLGRNFMSLHEKINQIYLDDLSFFGRNFISFHEKINQTYHDELPFFGRKFSHICTQFSSSSFLQFGQLIIQTSLVY